MKCKICSKEAVSEYCEVHEKAHKKVLEKYEIWKQALDISWKQYLNEIINNPLTGVWAKEVAEDLIKKER